MAVLFAPNWALPPELAHELPVLEFARPTRNELDAALQVIESTSGISCKQSIRPGLLDAASGLCLQEAENAIALSLVRSGSYEREILEREKMAMINKSGLLEIHPAASPNDVGGLDILLEYITNEVIPAKNNPMLRVKGILLAGIPGSGKSLVAKATGSWLNWPVIRMDIGRLKGSLVGQSEANMKNCLDLITAVAPAVVWCDEVEKSLGGHLSSARTDGGTTLGMISQLLTYMQESTAQTFWVATCNNYELLPTEFTRAGRFDEKFWTDVPTDAEREQIAAIHLHKLGVSGDAHKVAINTKDFTGAEIEAAIKSAIRRGGNFHATFETVAANMKPLAVANAAQIAAFRDWAQDTLKPASRQEVKSKPNQRKVSVN
jgi:SpoVK/Ycf46/Vps4 family AAA+-type ATPase